MGGVTCDSCCNFTKFDLTDGSQGKDNSMADDRQPLTNAFQVGRTRDRQTLNRRKPDKHTTVDIEPHASPAKNSIFPNQQSSVKSKLKGFDNSSYILLN